MFDKDLEEDRDRRNYFVISDYTVADVDCEEDGEENGRTYLVITVWLARFGEAEKIFGEYCTVYSWQGFVGIWEEEEEKKLFGNYSVQ